MGKSIEDVSLVTSQSVGLDENSWVMLISTEEDTDKDDYQRILNKG